MFGVLWFWVFIDCRCRLHEIHSELRRCPVVAAGAEDEHHYDSSVSDSKAACNGQPSYTNDSLLAD